MGGSSLRILKFEHRTTRERQAAGLVGVLIGSAARGRCGALRGRCRLGVGFASRAEFRRVDLCAAPDWPRIHNRQPDACFLQSWPLVNRVFLVLNVQRCVTAGHCPTNETSALNRMGGEQDPITAALWWGHARTNGHPAQACRTRVVGL